MRDMEFNEWIVDTMDARELLNNEAKSLVENMEFYTMKNSYDPVLDNIRFGEETTLW